MRAPLVLLALVALVPATAHASMCYPRRPKPFVTPVDGATEVPREVEARVLLDVSRPVDEAALAEDYRLVDARGAVVPLASKRVEANALSMKPRAPLAPRAKHRVQVRAEKRWRAIATFTTGEALEGPAPVGVQQHRASEYLDVVPSHDAFVHPRALGRGLRAVWLELELLTPVDSMEAIALEVDGFGVVKVLDGTRLREVAPAAAGGGVNRTVIGAGPSRCWPYGPTFLGGGPHRLRAVVWTATGERRPVGEWLEAQETQPGSSPRASRAPRGQTTLFPGSP